MSRLGNCLKGKLLEITMFEALFMASWKTTLVLDDEGHVLIQFVQHPETTGQAWKIFPNRQTLRPCVGWLVVHS